MNCLSCGMYPEKTFSLWLLAPYLVTINAIPTTFVLIIPSLITYPNPIWILVSTPIASTATFHGPVILWNSRRNHHLHCMTLGKSWSWMTFLICWPNSDLPLILFIQIFAFFIHLRFKYFRQLRCGKWIYQLIVGIFSFFSSFLLATTMPTTFKFDTNPGTMPKYLS